MKVLDLLCSSQHGFEGWFGSEVDFQDQLARGLVQCPICGDAAITKRLSAPRLNLGAEAPSYPNLDRSNLPVAKGDTGATSSEPVIRAENKQEAVQVWLEMTKQLLANTDDVGNQFAEEARRIHYGEAKERSIRGHATPDERDALLDEGISVLPFLIPEALKKPLQ